MQLQDRYLDRIADALETQMGVNPKLIGGNVLKLNIDRIADALDQTPVLLKDGTIKISLARIADAIESGNFGGRSGDENVSITKILTQGQVSSTDDYVTANFDSQLNFSDYECLKIYLFRNGTLEGTSIFALQDVINSNSSRFTFYIYNESYKYTMELNKSNKTISCTNYSGSYVDLYVDVYGVNISVNNG